MVMDISSLQAYVSATTQERGRELLRSGRVLECSLDVDGFEWAVAGRVQGTQRRPYHTQATVVFDASGNVDWFESTCSCPVGDDCKHGVALVGKAMDMQRSTAHASGPVAVMSDKQQQRVAHWLEQLELVQDSAQNPAALASSIAPDEEQPVYLLQASTPRGSSVAQLHLSWKMSRRKKSGEWIKPRPPSFMAQYALVSERAEHGLSPDQECIRILQGLQEGAGHLQRQTDARTTLQGEVGAFVLQKCAVTGRLFWQAEDGLISGPPLHWSSTPAPLAWDWQPASAPASAVPLWQLQPQVRDEQGQGRPLSDNLQVFAGPPALYVDLQQHQCGLLALPAGMDAALLAVLLDAPPLPADMFHAAQGRLVQRLAPLQSFPPGVEAPSAWPQCTLQPVLTLRPLAPALRPQHGLMQAQLVFDYQGLVGDWGDHAAVVAVTDPRAPGRTVLLTRDLQAEAQVHRQLQALGLQCTDPSIGYVCPSEAVWLEWAAQDWQPLRAAGFTLQLEAQLDGWVHTVQALDVRLAAPDDMDTSPSMGAEGDGMQDAEAESAWFDLSLGIEIDGRRHDVLPWLPGWLAQVRSGPSGPELPTWLWQEQADGRWLRLPSAALQPWLQALLELVQERDFSGDHVRLSRLEALRLAAGMDLGAGQIWEGAKPLRALLGQLVDGSGTLPDVPVPRQLQAQLRPYQQHGLNWLQFLRRHQLGGVLADDMGLGKTLQTLAHLLCEQEAGRLDRPCLVLAPVSLLGNWRREAARFTPSLRVHVWHGLERHSGPFAEDCDVLIAPYSLLQRDRVLWLEQRWHVLVLDEAQHIKNASSQAAQVVRALDARQRIALSGTPLENHLGELWSLFHFLMPGFLGSQKRFNALFRVPIEKQGDHAALQRLRQRVTPFMLRRTKTTVATELPPCIESITSVSLAGAQADLYETIRLATEKSVRDALAEKGLARSQIQLLDALLKLRQVCCDPRLVKNNTQAAKVKTSAKLERLMELLLELVGQGRKVLVFSQFTSMLSLIEDELARVGLAWTKLTGQTRERDAAIERFTSGAVPIFLISLKAGGTGLNLPQADTVIHYDPWWNPAVQAQATGRAHRIGQTRQVVVYKLVAEGTIEERILSLQERKATLAQGLLTGAAGRDQPLFTESDVAELLLPLGA